MFDPQRFLDAQAPIYPAVLAELEAGAKTSHWMWFVFPQLEGLGRSPTAQHYALQDIAAAKAYAAHPILGPRLRECTQAVLRHTDKTTHDIFGRPDDLKFCSSMTLFAHAQSEASVFRQALDAFYAGLEDPETRKRL